MPALFPGDPGVSEEESGNHTGSAAGLTALECVITNKQTKHREVKFQQNWIVFIVQTKKCGQIPTEED